MPRTDKTPAATRHGGPGAAEENATKAAPKVKGQANSRMKHLSDVSGGGGERDTHHSHDPKAKGDRHR